MKKTKYAIGTILIPAVLTAGCGTKEFHYYYMPESNKNPAGYLDVKDNQVVTTKDFSELQKNKIKSSLLSEVVTHQLDDQKRKEFLASSLLYFIKNDFNQKVDLNTNYIEQVLNVDESKILFESGKYFDQKVNLITDASERYRYFLEKQASDFNSKNFNSFELAKLIENTKITYNKSGLKEAKSYFDHQMTQWSTEIAEITFDASFQDAQIQKQVQNLISNAKNGLVVIPKITASVSEIAKNLPEISETQKTIKEIYSKIDTIGTSKIDFKNKINESIANDVKKSIERVRDLTKKISSDVNEIQNKSKKFEDAKNVYDKVESGIALGSKLYQSVFGPNQDVEKIANVANSVIKVSKIVSSFNFGKLGANLATGNMVAAVGDIVGSLFGGSEPGPDPVTKQLLMDIRNDIADFRNHVDQRFDEVIGKLDQQLKLLQEMDVKIVDIRNILNEMTLSISQLSQKIDQGFDSIFADEFQKNFEVCFKSNLFARQDLNRLNECLSYFAHFSKNTAFNPQQSGLYYISEKSTNQEIPYDVISSILDEPGSLNKLGFLDVTMRNIFGGTDSNGKRKQCVDLVHMNIADFIMGVESYLLLVKVHPELTKDYSTLSVINMNISEFKQKASLLRKSLLDLEDRKFLAEKVNDYFTDARSLMRSNSFKVDHKKLKVKHKLLVNLFKIVDPSNIYKTNEFEDLFDLNGFSKIHVNFENYTIEKKGESFDPKNIEYVGSLLRDEKDKLNDYLASLYQSLEKKNRITTLIDPVLDHIEFFEKGLQPRF